ncbi:MAC/Perforin domain protein [Gigaspora margarita]|uniref:MAC/Perforin domain protein n=1 Tax=Gigaspora margarita TaxID=4874 RepID=A0A8H3X959_GIGMA|nr:MAC/Perforin domain protein [Gigaspora margarita]
MAWIPGLDELGSGYDYLNGQYAQSESCTENFFDWSDIPTYERKLNGQSYFIPNIVNFYPKIAVEYISVAGESLDEYHECLSNTVDIGVKICGFTGSLNTEFGKVVDYNKFRKFSRIQYDYSSHLLHLTSSPSILKKYIKPEIRSEINDPKIDPEIIFRRYGSHFIRSLKMGGRIVISASTNKLTHNSNVDLKLLAKAAASEIICGELPNEYDEDEVLKFRQNSDLDIHGCGGDIRALGNDMLHPNMDAWAATVPNNPAFITFDRSDSLLFIGDLVEDETRRKQFIDAWQVYVNIHKRKFKSFDPPYLEYTIVSSTINATELEHHKLGTRPIVNQGSKWKWLAVSYFKNNEGIFGILIREKPHAEGLLRPIVKSRKLCYSDIYDYYRIHPLTDDPDEFVSLGCFFESIDDPVNIKNLVGVHRSLCVHGEPGETVDDCSWTIAPQDGTLHLSTITCSNSFNPIYESIWLLKTDFIEYVNF